MSEDDLWFLPGTMAEDAPPLPGADAPSPVDPRDWLRAQAELAVDLARAAQALGALDAVVAGDAGMIRRLALTEIEAMLWAAGTPLAREDIGRDAMAGRASSDPHVLSLARWALRRLEGQADTADLRGFLGLHRVDSPSEAGRAAGDGFDAAAAEFLALTGDPGLHPLTRAALSLRVWPLAGLSPPEDLAEGASFAARIAATDLTRLPFAPLGHAGRRIWRQGGAPTDRLRDWLAAIRNGADHARAEALRLDDWAARALRSAGAIKGRTPAGIITALRATPLMTTEMVAQQIGSSRITAERMLARLQQMGLIREITGARRFRLWSAP